MSFIYPRRDCLQETDMDTIGRSSRPDKDTFSISPSGHFYIHYDTTGNHAPDLTGNPNYVEEVGMIADSAYHVLVDVMGYAAEPFDGEGGYDIYIMSYSPGAYGFNYTDSPSQNQNGATSYLTIDNDYLGFNSIFGLTPIQIMRISVSHEYFHGIQRGYRNNLGNNAYFYEMCAMWFEDVLIPDGNDYIDGWADPLLNNPTADFDNTGGGYELALFGHYLSSFLDPNGIENVFNSTIIREIWDRFGDTNSSALYAVRHVLDGENYSLTFIEAWVDFISRNLYNGIYPNMENPFYYYIDQALIEPITTNSQLLSDSETFSLGINNESAAIQSYEIGEFDVLLDIDHSSDEYFGRIPIVSTSYYNDILFGIDASGVELASDSEIHFIYASETQGSVTIDIMSTYFNYPYDYSLVDINTTSTTYDSTISPSYFEDLITLHYFGHQN